MLHNLMAGSVLASLTVLIHMAGLIVIAAVTPQLARRLGFHAHDVGRTLVMTATVLGILAILTLEVWAWATAYDLLGVTRTFADALYLSSAMFSTIGYGEMTLNPAWRQLTALEGIIGFLMIGWSTAYLVRASTLHGPFRGDHF
ncbi:MAG: potassium channel family protein [Alphaproteobacteria bacterium]